MKFQKVGSSEKDIVVEIEALEFTDGIMELTPQTEETVTLIFRQA